VLAGPPNASVEDRLGAADDVVTPANVEDVTGRPSRPMTTGEWVSVVWAALVAANESSATKGVPPAAPETNGTERTSAVSTVLTSAPRASRPPR
jgi:hypothetical protein